MTSEFENDRNYFKNFYIFNMIRKIVENQKINISIMTPYTYLIKFKPTSQVYYGCRYSTNCHPEDLWKTYFTSSNQIKKLIKLHGHDAFEFEVRRIFSDAKSALAWERKILIKFHVQSNPKFLNLSNGYKHFSIGPKSDETKQKMSLAKKGISKSKDHCKAISLAQTKRYSKVIRPEKIRKNRKIPIEEKILKKQKSDLFRKRQELWRIRQQRLKCIKEGVTFDRRNYSFLAPGIERIQGV